MIAGNIKDNKHELVDALYLMLLQGVNQLLPLFVMPYLMIKLGASGYGYVGFSLSVIQYLVLVVDFGFNLSATKRIAQVKDNERERNRIFWNVVLAKSLLLLASSAVLGILLLVVPTFQLYSKAILATWPMVVGNTFTFMWLFQGIGKVRMFSVMNTLSKIIVLPLIFIFVKQTDDYVLAALLQALVFVSTAVISNVYLYQRHLVKWIAPTCKEARVELSESFPLFLSTASTSAYTQLVVIILGFYCTTEEMGRYTSADRIMRALCFLLYVPLNQVFFPKISALAIQCKEQAQRLFRQVRLLVVSVMILAGMALFFGGPLLPYVLGKDYAGIQDYLYIMAIAPIAIGIGGVYGQMGLVALGNKQTSKAFRNVYVIAAACSILMMFVLTPWLKGLGASIVVTLTEVLVMTLMVYNFNKYKNVCC